MLNILMHAHHVEHFASSLRDLVNQPTVWADISWQSLSATATPNISSISD